MPTDVTLACDCGTVRGVAHGVTPDNVNRLVCYCGDCQSFACHLGRADDLFDRHGGTEIVQMAPVRLELTHGREQLACLRLRKDGLVRWYARCCRTPIANTLFGPRPPFAGVFRRFVEDPAATEAVLGPVRAHVNLTSVKDRATLEAPDRPPARAIVRLLRLMFSWWISGDPRRSALRRPDGQPLVTPEVLTADELRRAGQARDAWQPPRPA
jgi:hypothetical protein